MHDSSVGGGGGGFKSNFDHYQRDAHEMFTPRKM
jgi:hypothetical protein